MSEWDKLKRKFMQQLGELNPFSSNSTRFTTSYAEKAKPLIYSLWEEGDKLQRENKELKEQIERWEKVGRIAKRLSPKHYEESVATQKLEAIREIHRIHNDSSEPCLSQAHIAQKKTLEVLGE